MCFPRHDARKRRQETLALIGHVEHSLSDYLVWGELSLDSSQCFRKGQDVRFQATGCCQVLIGSRWTCGTECFPGPVLSIQCWWGYHSMKTLSLVCILTLGESRDFGLVSLLPLGGWSLYFSSSPWVPQEVFFSFSPLKVHL